MSRILEDLEGLLTPVLESEGIELVDLSYQREHGGWVLRFSLDKAGGITLDDCAVWSRKLGLALDESALLTEPYMLEVSSPGLDRPLKKLKDFQRFTGERVSVKLFAAINGQKNFHGILVGADEENIRLKLLDADREVTLPRSQVAKSKLDPVIEF